MTQQGGKRKAANKSLKAWVAFVKKVQRQEKLSYREAMHRAKQRKDKGEKWMKGGGDDYGSGASGDSSDSGNSSSDEDEVVTDMNIDVRDGNGADLGDLELEEATVGNPDSSSMSGGRRRKRRRSSSRRKSAKTNRRHRKRHRSASRRSATRRRRR